MRKTKSTSCYTETRKKKKYPLEIPDRKSIFDVLNNAKSGLSLKDIIDSLSLSAKYEEPLSKRINAMAREGQLISNRKNEYSVLDETRLFEGSVIAHPRGFGFLDCSCKDMKDIFLPIREMNQVFDGDIAMVRIIGLDRKGRPEGRVAKVIERKTPQLVGRFFLSRKRAFVRPDHPRISRDILIECKNIDHTIIGQIVVVKVNYSPFLSSQPTGRIVEILGERKDPGIETALAIRTYSIPQLWSKEVRLEIQDVKETIQHCSDRVDLRQLPFVTIDGEDAKDFDDAVYCEEKIDGGWKLIVAIADVSHYVLPDSVVNKEALERGTSVYFPDHVVPMLPAKLSNELCSLLPNVDRFCIACEMHVDISGEVQKFRFFQSTINSHARMNYTQVATIMENSDPIKPSKNKPIFEFTPQILVLKRLYQALASKRKLRGTIDFETQETRLLFDGQRKVKSILPLERTVAHRLVEECMLCANACAARLLNEIGAPTLYRVHQAPDALKVDSLRSFLQEIGIELGGGNKPQPQDYSDVLRKINNREDKSVIEAVMLRSMSRAVYQTNNIGHFGLSYEVYTHFTSPIRRFSDLVVHRVIRNSFKNECGTPFHGEQTKRCKVEIELMRVPLYSVEDLDDIGYRVSLSERRADEATRDVANGLKCEYLMDRIGEQFFGMVTQVTSFGLFITLDDLRVEGLLHVSKLSDDYYEFNPILHRLTGEKRGHVFQLGQRLNVSINHIIVEQKKINFDLVTARFSSKLFRKPDH